MQSPEIVLRLLPDLRTGKKRHTIRWRERTIVPGPMRYVNAQNADDTLVVQVTAVKTMLLSAVAGYPGKEEEWPDSVLLEAMREHYPDIQLDSEVDVIRHSSRVRE